MSDHSEKIKVRNHKIRFGCPYRVWQNPTGIHFSIFMFCVPKSVRLSTKTFFLFTKVEYIPIQPKSGSIAQPKHPSFVATVKSDRTSFRNELEVNTFKIKNRLHFKWAQPCDWQSHSRFNLSSTFRFKHKVAKFAFRVISQNYFNFITRHHFV